MLCPFLLLCAELLEKILCKTDPTKSYALYFPSSYMSDKQWPILYCLDANLILLFPSACGDQKEQTPCHGADLCDEFKKMAGRSSML